MSKLITLADKYHKDIIQKILDNGSVDKYPRPHWEDGSPAHTISINHELCKYDLANGDCPFLTLRPIATKSAFGEILWIYQDASNDLIKLRSKYHIHWWDEWEIPGTDSIGACYGETVRRHNLMRGLLDNMVNDPDGRRHILSLWQVDDFKDAHGLKPCCFQSIFNIRRPKGDDQYNYIDMVMIQRSSDFITSVNINELQYIALLYMVVGHMNKHSADGSQYVAGTFSHFINNIQIYDRHIDAAKEILNRQSVEFDSVDEMPQFAIPTKDFYDYTVDDIKIMNTGYIDKVKEINPQIKLEIAI